MEELVVTGTRFGAEVRRLPRHVTVITREDIEQAPGNNLGDLLAREGDVTLRSSFGHDKVSAVDVRGMGEASVSNVLVLVDGVRLNPPDLAGPDLSSIPIDQVERIEILRGAGSVLYGDGAVGGVINIITRKGGEGLEVQAHSSAGSYESYDQRASIGGRTGGLTYNLSGSYYDTEGYRDNGFFRKTDVGFNLGYEFEKVLKVFGSGAWHEDKYGLPGPVSLADLYDADRRRATGRPEDYGQTEDQRYMAGFEADFKKYGLVRLRTALRKRDNEYILGYTPLLTRQEQLNNIDENTGNLDLSYKCDYQLWGLDHSLQLGLDLVETDYVREEKSTAERHNSLIRTTGIFVLSRWSLPKNLTLQAGYRRSSFDGDFRDDRLLWFGTDRSWINGNKRDRSWDNDAWELGLLYSPVPDLTLFAGYSTSFRNPNVDELAQAEEDLKPQHGQHFELGVRGSLGLKAEFSATLFQARIEDEIYYGEDPVTGLAINRNYDSRTLRRGLEIDFKFYPTDYLYIWGNYTYMIARFEGRDADLPLVPHHQAGAGFEWLLSDPLTLAVSWIYVGRRYDGNDLTNNRYATLEGYKVADLKLTYQYKGLKVFAGINNLFNEYYSTVAYSETYYPMPDRNFFLGLEYRH